MVNSNYEFLCLPIFIRKWSSALYQEKAEMTTKSKQKWYTDGGKSITVESGKHLNGFVPGKKFNG
jgi:hypothetical protein